MPLNKFPAYPDRVIPDYSVQRGVTTMTTATTSVAVTLGSTVVTTKSFVNAAWTGTAAWGGTNYPVGGKAYLTASDTLTITMVPSSNAVTDYYAAGVTWEVIELA